MIDQALREALEADPRSIYEIAKQTDTEPDLWYRFKAGKDVRLATAAKLAAALGLELAPINRTRKRAKSS